MAINNRGAGRSAGLKGTTIYVSPSDYPGQYVCRGWVASGEEIIASQSAVVFPLQDTRALAKVRSDLQAQGAVRFPRAEHDDEAILETWI